jgi:DDE superfamily endonuclease
MAQHLVVWYCVSPAYGGAVSDRQIVERSNLPDMCNPQDSVMADKGFNVQDFFATHDVTVNVPTFFKKKNRMRGIKFWSAGKFLANVYTLKESLVQ